MLPEVDTILSGLRSYLEDPPKQTDALQDILTNGVKRTVSDAPFRQALLLHSSTMHNRNSNDTHAYIDYNLVVVQNSGVCLSKRW